MLVIASLLLFAKVVVAEDNISMPPLSIPDKIDYFADKYNVESKVMHKIIKCESNYNPRAVNWQDSHRLSKGSHGIGQFSKETIKGFGKEIDIENADPYNVDQALEVMAYMLSEDKGRHWSCFRK